MKTNRILPAALALAGLLAWPAALPASPALDLAKQLNQAFIEVAEKVSPSVVVIDVVQRSSGGSWSEDGSPWDMLPPGLRRRLNPQYEPAPTPKARGEGSGVIIREDGFILTNRHVVEDAEKIEVRLKDGRKFRAEVRGTDPQSDVAVLKIEAKGLPTAKLADSSQTRVGEFAIAIGAPFSLDYSVTYGHVSAKGRSGIILDSPLMDQDFIQTDANINPGNSGGPLVNINSEVIGINTLIRGVGTGIGFAIPSNLAREVAEKLITDGKYARTWLGIGIVSYRDFLDRFAALPGVTDGVVVKSIEPDGPAAKSDLKPTDVITAVDGVAVKTAQELKNEIRRKPASQLVTLDVIRAGKPTKIKVKTAARETEETAEIRPVNAPGDDTSSPVGISVQTLTPTLAQHLETTATAGVVITDVQPGSLADRCRLQRGDVITEVAQKPVKTAQELRAALKGADFKKGVLLTFTRGKTSQFEVLKDGEE